MFKRLCLVIPVISAKEEQAKPNCLEVLRDPTCTLNEKKVLYRTKSAPSKDCREAASCIAKAKIDEAFFTEKFSHATAEYTASLTETIRNVTAVQVTLNTYVTARDAFCGSVSDDILLASFVRRMTEDEIRECPVVYKSFLKGLVDSHVLGVQGADDAKRADNSTDKNITESLTKAYDEKVSAMCQAIEGLRIDSFDHGDEVLHIEEWCPHLIVAVTQNELETTCQDDKAKEVKSVIKALSETDSKDYSKLLAHEKNCSRTIDRFITEREREIVSERARAFRIGNSSTTASPLLRTLLDKIKEKKLSREFATSLPEKELQDYARLTFMLERMGEITEAVKGARAEVKKAADCFTTVTAISAKSTPESLLQNLNIHRSDCPVEVECELLHEKLRIAANSTLFEDAVNVEGIAKCKHDLWLTRFAETLNVIKTAEKTKARCDELVKTALESEKIEEVVKIQSEANSIKCSESDLNQISVKLGNSTNSESTLFSARNLAIGGTAAVAAGGYMFRDKLKGLYNSLTGKQAVADAPEEKDAGKKETKGLSRGAVAGIVIGVLVIAGMIAGGVYVYRQRQNDY